MRVVFELTHRKKIHDNRPNPLLCCNLGQTHLDFMMLGLRVGRTAESRRQRGVRLSLGTSCLTCSRLLQRQPHRMPRLGRFINRQDDLDALPSFFAVDQGLCPRLDGPHEILELFKMTAI